MSMKIFESRLSIFDWKNRHPAGTRNDASFYESPRKSKIKNRCNRSGEAGTARLSKFPEGFTLVELLIVIAIIAILAALTLNTAGYIQKKAARSRAETEIAALSAALESYKADTGDYPTGTASAPSGDNAFLRTNLSPAETSKKVYFEFSKTMGDNLTTGPIVDPFGENYGYQYPGNANRSGTNFFDLWSRGASTKTNQWIKNW